ncbi:MAG: biopolymer transporter ExbD [Bacteroidetes bacterium]|nr:biopolymer transporter ExbD [Bacteroidota bacterium]
MDKLNLKSERKIDVHFSMSSMTDIVFLLLIFFMITSSFDNIEGLNLDLPKSSHSKEISEDIKIIITSNKEYIIDNKKVILSELKGILETKIINKASIPKILIESDKNALVDNIVELANLAKSISAESVISLATRQ